MDLYAYRSGRLFCEDVDLTALAAEVGTPAYVYSAGTLRHHYRSFAEAFAPLDATVCFAIKSLSNLSVLKLFVEWGAGFDVVSGGEVFREQRAGADMSRVVFAGVGKTDREINEAIAAGVGVFNVESEAEFENLARLARAAAAPVTAALRVNPDVDPRTHTYTTTGKKETKFGVDIERAERFFAAYGRDAYARLTGLHLHIGSPVNTIEPYVEAITKALALIERLRAAGSTIDTLDIGGGFGADYETGQAPQAARYAEKIVPLLARTGLKIIVEPGRQISCNAGVLLTEVQYLKAGGDKHFAIVDGSMTDLIRPALYDGWHFIYPVVLPDGAEPPVRSRQYAPAGAMKVDVVGGVCESSDFLGKERRLPALHRGDLLAVFSAGAYGFTMASQYNSRPRTPEVLVEGDRYRVVRRRETYEDLIDAEA
ncbi:MAG: diaminopimelate decarboxylase [Planctomycetes bacterium]|nr:diaminopimelate decarboxylase [Planctomycetota bacterium]